MENQLTYLEKKQKANRIVRFRTLLAAGTGFVPVPVLDVVGVMTIQLWMIRDLAKVYSIPFRKHVAKSLIGSLVGNVSSASLIKLIPGVGTFLGGGAGALTSGASTYALGKIFTQHFDQGGTLLSFDPVKSQEHFRELYKEGQVAVRQMQQQPQTDSIEDLRISVALLQKELEETKKNQFTLANIREKTGGRFRWFWRLLLLVILIAVGIQGYRMIRYRMLVAKNTTSEIKTPANSSSTPKANAPGVPNDAPTTTTPSSNSNDNGTPAVVDSLNN